MRSKGFFLLLLVFSTSAFAWWVYLLITLQQEVGMAKANELYSKVYEAESALMQEEFSGKTLTNVQLGATEINLDTTKFDQLKNRFPQLQFFIENNRIYISPKLELLEEISEARALQIALVSLQGLLFFALLVTGYTWIYRSLVSTLDLNRQQNNFLLSVTHELKTPIASLQLMLQTMVMHDLNHEDNKELAIAGVSDAYRLNELVENILLATRIEGECYQFHQEETGLDAWLSAEMEKFTTSFGSRYDFESQIEEGIRVNIDRFSFRLVLHNVLENAMKYSPAYSRVKVILRANGSFAFLEVADQGRGIAIKEREKIFQKFYRGGEENRRETKGTGLGLYIAREVMKSQGGSIYVEDNKPEGSIFIIKIPKL